MFRKILFLDYHTFDKEDIEDAFRYLGYEVVETDIPMTYKGNEEKIKEELSILIKRKDIDMVFSSNYFIEASKECACHNVPYVSWTYDSPRIQLYDRTVKNACNYIFIFDSSEYNRLVNKGVHRVFYLPLGVNVERLDAINISQQDAERYSADVSLVASLYNEKANFYDRMEPLLSDYARGYVQALVEAQKNLTCGSVLEEAAGNPQILSDMINAIPYKLKEGSLTDHTYVYGNYVLARKASSLQRIKFIRDISRMCRMKVYTPGDISDIPEAIDMGVVDYKEEACKVFRCSKINLNITLASIQSGIPLRAIVIMGSGGFLLTNYQADFDGLFEPGIDYVYYTSIEDAKELIRYYLENDEEREIIAQNGYNKVKQAFTYRSLIEQMMEMIYDSMGVKYHEKGGGNSSVL